jgi:hypothetical protein
MPTQLLNLGTTPITQNTIYALPARRAILFSDATTPTFQLSNTEAFTASVAVTLTNGQAEANGGFIRCTSATPGSITLKPF